MSDLTPIMTREALDQFLRKVFPQISTYDNHYTILDIQSGLVQLALDPADQHVRPGGTISGPSLFTLCDYAAYYVILAHIGEVELTVTTNMSINFLNKPELGRLVCSARILKLGKRLTVIDCQVHDQNQLLVAQASGTYSIPPRSIPPRK